jgi:tetratricopeptide (TPR) repeat protein
VAFSQQLTPQSRAYGKVLEGQIALKERRMADAVDAFTAAQKFADLWLARFNLGIAYIEAGAFPEALGELDRSQKRRGEATAVLLDEVPTFRYLATLPYWLGRAQEGALQRAAAKENYKAFLAIRSGSPRDLTVIDARKRLASE